MKTIKVFKEETLYFGYEINYNTREIKETWVNFIPRDVIDNGYYPSIVKTIENAKYLLEKQRLRELNYAIQQMENYKKQIKEYNKTKKIKVIKSQSPVDR